MTSHTVGEPLVQLPAPFVDGRGAIQPLVDEPLGSAQVISCKKDTVRGNHHHKSDWHYCYVVSGTIDYYWRPAGSSDAPRRVRVEAGQMFFTPAMTDHAMLFPEDTTFLNLARNPRDQDSYEEDVVRVELV
jgi:uncharacterized RmlC-like cupin family protein